MRIPIRYLLVTAAFAGSAGPASAHETGVLRPAVREFPLGGTVRVAGEKFSKRTTLTLALLGTRGRIELGKVRTDSAGRFEIEVAVPASGVEGSYRLVAFAPDGDRVAGIDVVVVTALPSAPPVADEHAGHAEESAAPSAEPLQLQRGRSGGVTAGAVGFIVITALAGGLLLRRRAATT